MLRGYKGRKDRTPFDENSVPDLASRDLLRFTNHIAIKPVKRSKPATVAAAIPMVAPGADEESGEPDPTDIVSKKTDMHQRFIAEDVLGKVIISTGFLIESS